MKFFYLLAACISLPLAAQTPEFHVFATSNGHTCTWSIKNVGSSAVKISNASLRLFYTHDAISIYPNSVGQPTISRQSSGSYTGNNKTFKHKTYLLFSLDTLLDAGNSVNLVTVDNASQKQDTILIAGVDIFYSENSTTKTVNAYPPNETPCPAEYLFLDAGRTNSGIKTLGFANTTLHPDNCINGISAIVFDGNTLKRKSVAAPIPNCSNGKLWTNLGYSRDSLIYYSFDLSNNTHALQFDTLVSNMQSGDYIALATQSMHDFSKFTQISASLAALGFNSSLPTANPGYFTMLGRKGANNGEAKFDSCTDAHLNCTVSMEQSMISNAPAGKIPSFGSCFENLVQILEKEPANSKQSIHRSSIGVFPNPSMDVWNIRSNSKIAEVLVQDALGRTVLHFENTNEIPCGQLKTGLYYITVITEGGNKVVVAANKL